MDQKILKYKYASGADTANEIYVKPSPVSLSDNRLIRYFDHRLQALQATLDRYEQVIE